MIARIRLFVMLGLGVLSGLVTEGKDSDLDLIQVYSQMKQGDCWLMDNL